MEESNFLAQMILNNDGSATIQATETEEPSKNDTKNSDNTNPTSDNNITSNAPLKKEDSGLFSRIKQAIGISNAPLTSKFAIDIQQIFEIYEKNQTSEKKQHSEISFSSSQQFDTLQSLFTNFDKYDKRYQEKFFIVVQKF